MPQLSTQSLAYLGDAVFELYVRTRLLAEGDRPIDALNRKARRYVSATGQAVMYHRIKPLLTEAEKTILQRGRNLHGTSRSKAASVTDYRHATGLEVLFGYLFANGEKERLDEIFAWCIENELETEDRK